MSDSAEPVSHGVGQRLRTNWLRVVAHFGALSPLILMMWRYWNGLFFANPIQSITTHTGRAALGLLALSLACTPLYVLTRFKQVMRVRRALGLYAFLYAGLHFLTFAGWDYGFDLGLLGPAIFDQRFVLPGAAAFLLLLSLAITSTQGWQKRLGKKWKLLHRLSYLASALVILHFLWSGKDSREPLRYGIIIALLLILRIPAIKGRLVSFRQWLTPKRKVVGT